MTSRTARRTLAPALAAASLLTAIAATPLPASARDRDRDEAARRSSLPRESVIRDREGFRVGRAQEYRDSRTVFRDERGFRTGGIRRDGTITDKNGYRVGRIDRR